MTRITKSAQQVCDYYPVYALNRIYNSPHVTGNPVSGIREIYACGIRNAAYFCREIRNPGHWNPVHNSRNLESGVRVPLRKNPKSNALLDSLTWTDMIIPIIRFCHLVYSPRYFWALFNVNFFCIAGLVESLSPGQSIKERYLNLVFTRCQEGNPLLALKLY